MDNKIDEIRKLYFDMGKKAKEVADELNVSKQYVSKILKEQFEIEYLIEKEKRKKANKEKRKSDNSYSNLKRQHEIDVIAISKRGRMSTQSAVFYNMSAYDVRGNRLVFNEKVGKRPADLPKSYSLKVYY